MDYLFILYILVSVGVSLGGLVILIQSERTLGGFLFLMGCVLIFTFYGLRWFYGENLKITQYTSNEWPPIINTCPDFLTLTKDSSGKEVCIDMVGVATGGIQKFVDQANLGKPTHTFRLFKHLSGLQRNKAISDEAKNLKVTWEGVYDGQSYLLPQPQ